MKKISGPELAAFQAFQTFQAFPTFPTIPTIPTIPRNLSALLNLSGLSHLFCISADQAFNHPTRAPSVPPRRTPNHPNHPPHRITTIVGDRPIAVVAPMATGRARFVHFKPIPGSSGQFETPVSSHHGPGLPATLYRSYSRPDRSRATL